MRAVATISALVLFAACAVQLEGELESVSLEGFDFNPKAPDVTIAPVDVVCEISLYVDPGGTGGTGGTTPGGIGIRDTGCVFMSPNGLHSTSCVATNPTIGDIFDGTWECTARVDMAVEDGTWKVSHVFARDYEYKHVSVDTAGLAGFPTDLIVTSNEDLAGPDVTDFDITPASVELGGTFECDVAATDLLSNMGDRGCTITNPTCVTGTGKLHEASCIAAGATSTCDTTIPNNVICEGTWTVTSVFARDVVGNRTNLDTAAIAALPATTIVYVGTGGFGGAGGAGGSSGAGGSIGPDTGSWPTGPLVDTCTENAEITGGNSPCVCEGAEYDTGYCCTEGFSYSACSSTELYMKPSASGTGDGSSWTDAMAFTTSMVRDRVYWIASGDYTTDTRTFSTACVACTEGITIRKATAAMHGTETGWSAGLGTGQATFGQMVFSTDRWTMDGGERNGIKSTPVGEVNGNLVLASGDYIVMRNMEMDGNTTIVGGVQQTGICSSLQITGAHIVADRNDMHHAADDGVEIVAADDVYLFNNKIRNLYACGTDGNCDGPCFNGHSDGIEINGGTDNVVISGNVVYDIYNTGAMIIGGPEAKLNFDINNNIFYSPATGLVVVMKSVDNVAFHNNIVWGRTQGTRYGGLAVMESVTSLSMYNNILTNINFNHQTGTGYDSGEHTLDHNQFGVIDLLEYPLNANDQVGDPLFAGIPLSTIAGDHTPSDLQIEEFALPGDSPAVDVGNTTGPGWDMLGTSRPLLVRDMGVYEIEGDNLPPGDISGNGNITGVWAQTGEDKVTQDEVRESTTDPTNSVFVDRTKVTLFGMRNEVVSFNTVIEADTSPASSVAVTMTPLTSGMNTITYDPDRYTDDPTGDKLFNWTTTNIELFYVRYVPINGISDFAYADVDFNQLIAPAGMQATSGNLWANRPNKEKYYPDIAVPLELENDFTVPVGNQQIWADIYIPDDAVPGTYTGTMTISEPGAKTIALPIELEVHDYLMPDTPSAVINHAFVQTSFVNQWHLGQAKKFQGTSYAAPVAETDDLINTYYQVARRHRVDLSGNGFAGDPDDLAINHPLKYDRLDGTLFSAAQGYDGPGVDEAVSVWVLGADGPASYRSPWCDASSQTPACTTQVASCNRLCVGGSNPGTDCTSNPSGTCTGGGTCYDRTYCLDDSDCTQSTTTCSQGVPMDATTAGWFADDWRSYMSTNFSGVRYYLYLVDEPVTAEALKYNTISEWMHNSDAAFPTMITKQAALKTGYCTLSPGWGCADNEDCNDPAWEDRGPCITAENLGNIDLHGTWLQINGGRQEEATGNWGARSDSLIAAAAAGDAYAYNGKRPATGSFVVEDDGTALRAHQWGLYKHDIDLFYLWSVNYWNDFQRCGTWDGTKGGTNADCARDPFEDPFTFGYIPTIDVCGGTCSIAATSCVYDLECPGAETCINKAATGTACSSGGGCYEGYCRDDNDGHQGINNGDGMIMYPGNEFDGIRPASSDYDLAGPIASLRLKHWRRGIQDLEYIVQANAVDSVATDAVVDAAVPKAWWEVFNGGGWSNETPSWSDDPDTWEEDTKGRLALLNIIETGAGGSGGAGGAGGDPGPGFCQTMPVTNTVTGTWFNVDAGDPAPGLLSFEGFAKVDSGQGIVAISDRSVTDFSDAAILVRFNQGGYFDAYDTTAYTCDGGSCQRPWLPDTWYNIVITADVAAQTYTVQVGECGQTLGTLITDAGFRGQPRGALTTYAGWGWTGPPTATLDYNQVLWNPEDCVPLTCSSFECGAPDNGCGTLLSCGTCPVGGDVCYPEGTCCTPDTCASFECGTPPDGCGQTLSSCGSCGAGEECIGYVCQATGNKPNASNTGASDVGALDTWANQGYGSTTITSGGTPGSPVIYEDFTLNTRLTVNGADYVTFRNCQISGGGSYTFNVLGGASNIILEDCELQGASSAMLYIQSGNFTGRRLYIHDGGDDGIKTEGQGPTLIEWSFVERLGTSSTAHADGNQTRFGSNATFRFNNIWMPVPGTPNYPGTPFKANATFMFKEDSTSISNLVVDNNWLNGGGYTIYCNPGVTITNNKYGRENGGWAEGKPETRLYSAPYGCGLVSGNVWEDTGLPAP